MEFWERSVPKLLYALCAQSKREMGASAAKATPLVHARRPSSLRDFLPDDATMELVCLFLGRTGGDGEAGLLWEEAQELARLVPGVELASVFRLSSTDARALMDANVRIGAVELYENSCWPAVFDALRVNTSLRELDLRMCRLEAQEVELLVAALTCNDTLRKLSLDHNGDGDNNDDGDHNGDGEGSGASSSSMFRALAPLVEVSKTLHVLHVAGIGGRGYSYLHSSRRQRAVRAQAQVSATSVDGAQFLTALRANTGLRDVNLCGNRLGPGIAAVVASNTNLVALDLWDYNLSSHECVTLAEGLVENSTMRTLNLRMVCLPSASGPALAEAFRKNYTLKTLHLTGTDLGEAWTDVCAALAVNKGLQRLGLGSCNLNSHVPTLATALQVNRVLRELDLAANFIDDESGWALIKSFEVNETLRCLDLGFHNLGEATLLKLATTLRVSNKALERLDVGLTNVTNKNAIKRAHMACTSRTPTFHGFLLDDTNGQTISFTI